MSARIKYHMEAFKELRTCTETRKHLEEIAQKLVDQANALSQTDGAEYELGKSSVIGSEAPRVRISVHTGNVKAAVDNKRHNTLLKALGGSGV